jgi:ABC-type multidrug transport system fused ATPase/permease subunit
VRPLRLPSFVTAPTLILRLSCSRYCSGRARFGVLSPALHLRGPFPSRVASVRFLSALPPQKSEDKDAETVEKKERGKLSEARRLLALYAPEKRPLALSISALSVSTAITMCVPFGMGKVIDAVTAAGGGADLPTVVGALGALFAAGAVANVVRVDTSNMIGERITNRLRQHTYESILSQDLGFFDSARTGELVNRLSADTTLIGKVLSDNVSAGLRSGGQALASISMLCYTCPQLALVMLSVVPPLAIGAVSYGRFVKKLTTRVQTQLSAATEVAEEKLANVRVVRWFSKEEHEKQVHQRTIDEVLALARKRSLASATFFGSVDLAVKMSMLGVLGYGGQMVTDGVLTSGELTSFLLYTLYVGFSFAGMSSFYSEMMKGIGASTRVFELLDRQPHVRSLDKWQPMPVGRHVVFEDVRFRYPTRPDAAVFDGLNLEVKPSETVALVGASGCGKSSLTALLARFYELDEGTSVSVWYGGQLECLQLMRSVVAQRAAVAASCWMAWTSRR